MYPEWQYSDLTSSIDTRATSHSAPLSGPHLTPEILHLLSRSQQLFKTLFMEGRRQPFTADLEKAEQAVKPLLSFIAVSMLVFGGFTRVALINLLASLCFELAQGCSVDKLYCKRLSCRQLRTICVTVKQSALLHWCKCIHLDFPGTVVLEHTLSLTS